MSANADADAALLLMLCCCAKLQNKFILSVGAQGS
jgi:hypothetical protein